MSKPKIYIDGKEGTTGLQIYERLGKRDDVELLLIDEDKRKDTEERRKFLNAADIVFLCLPDAAAKEAVTLIENDHTRVIDASITALPSCPRRTAPRSPAPGALPTRAATRAASFPLFIRSSHAALSRRTLPLPARRSPAIRAAAKR